MKKIDRVYLMTAGTLLPAFSLTFGIMSFTKLDAKATLLIFAAASVIGGYYTSKIIKSIE